MANFKTRAVTKEELEQIIKTMMEGFVLPSGQRIKPNERAAVALLTEANLLIRIGDVVRLKLCDIVFENDMYHLQITEEKTKKTRTFTVPAEFYTFLQTYALKYGIRPHQRLFPVGVRAIQNALHLTCEYLGLHGISTHSCRKFGITQIYLSSGYDIALCKEILNHSSINITTRYISTDSKRIHDELEKHIFIPA